MSVFKSVIDLFNSLLSREANKSERITEAKETIKEAKAENKKEKQDVKTVKLDAKQLRKMRNFVKKSIPRGEYKELSTEQVIEKYNEIKKLLDR